MESHPFDLLVQAVLRQQQLMEQLEEENWQLRRQLADLREGRVIYLDNDGKRFWLSEDTGRIARVTRPLAVPPSCHRSVSDSTTVNVVAPTTGGGERHLAEPQQGEEEEGKKAAPPAIMEERIGNAFLEQPTIPMELSLGEAQSQEPIDISAKMAV